MIYQYIPENDMRQDIYDYFHRNYHSQHTKKDDIIKKIRDDFDYLGVKFDNIYVFILKNNLMNTPDDQLYTLWRLENGE
jgi:hypothetical protein